MASLLDKRLILVAGKGGVGRSTVAAAIATATARRGKRTLLFEANANDRFGEFFGTAPVGPEIMRLRGDLHAVNTNPTAALEEYGLMILRFRRVYQMVFENRITRYFLRAIPGLDDYSILGKAWYHTTEQNRGRPAWDTVVFDMPASGHSLSMLRIPRAILETVPDGPLTRDARSLRALLADPARTALVLVTLAEEMPANEARELAESLDRELGIQVAHLVINQVYPPRFEDTPVPGKVLDALAASQRLAPGAAATATGSDRDLAALVAHSDLARSRRRLNQAYLEQLEREFPVPRTQLPYLFVPTIGAAQIEELSRTLEAL